jgi:hypothetical protein
LIGLSLKKQRLRERTISEVNKARQSTFDKFPKQTAEPFVKIEKSIMIAQLAYVIKEDELELSVAFRLYPSKNHFSNLTLELYFDDHKLDTHVLTLPPSQLLGDELEFPIALDMRGITAGTHSIKVELAECLNTSEKFFCASKYIIAQYKPIKREDRYIKIPIVKKIGGAFRIMLPEEQELYQDLEESKRQEIKSQRDKR